MKPVIKTKKSFLNTRLAFALCLVLAINSVIVSCANKKETAPIEVYFSPGGNCTENIVKCINEAKKTILVQSYSFTSIPIADALISAHQRGVVVKLIADNSHKKEKCSQINNLKNGGIIVRIDNPTGIAHNKVMIIDDSIVITGSFNWTTAAENRNLENLLIIRDARIANEYKVQWEKREAIAKPYIPATT